MYELRTDRALNRLHIALSGTFDEREAESLHLELVPCVHGLLEGFIVICDVSSLERFDPAARKHYGAFMDVCRGAGVGKVVHIVPDIHNNFGLTVMSYFHYTDVPVITCSSCEKASRHLLAAELL